MPESPDGAEPGGASPLGLALGFATLYLVWGSTYLAIRYAVETLPPFLMAGTRFLIAGSLLFAWSYLRGSPLPSWKHWRTAIVCGALLLLCGNGGVVWAQKTVPSGVAALLVTTTPLWLAVFEWMRPGGSRPSLATWAGLIVGFVAAAALAVTGKQTDDRPIQGLGATVLVLASVASALGSLFAKHAPRPASPLMSTGIQMLAGGALLALVGVASGEPATFDPSKVSRKSMLAVAYLLVFGSLLALTVFNWMLHVTRPTLVSTYIFVNPVIAVLLGWWLADETLTPAALVSGGVIVAAVAWLIFTQWRENPKRLNAEAAK